VSAAFTSNHLRDPRYDLDGRISQLLQRQIKGYSKQDPGTERQQCLPVEIFEKMIMRKTNDRFLQAYHENITLGFFFAMRACECFRVDGENRQTICIRKNGVMLFRNGRFVKHNDKDLEKCDQVAILFENQKNGLKNEIRYSHRTEHPVLCPVKAAVKIVKRLNELGATDRTPIHNFQDKNKKIRVLSSSICLKALREFIETVQEKEVLGLDPLKIGNRSLRTTSAMAMALNGAKDSEIQLYGRWQSNAFMDYLRPQIASFAAPMSRRMIQQSSIAFKGTPSTKPAEKSIGKNDIISNSHPNFDSIPGLLYSRILKALKKDGANGGLKMRW
jgi:hypothetical protein